jgi:hypothetical protein
VNKTLFICSYNMPKNWAKLYQLSWRIWLKIWKMFRPYDFHSKIDIINKALLLILSISLIMKIIVSGSIAELESGHWSKIHFRIPRSISEHQDQVLNRSRSNFLANSQNSASDNFTQGHGLIPFVADPYQFPTPEG